MDMTIRLARENDYLQLLKLLRQLNPDDPETSGVARQSFEEIIQARNLALIVADKGGLLVASCYLNILPNMTRGGRPYAVIENVITDSKHRQRGYGTAVVNRAIDMAGDANCYKIMLMSGRKDSGVHSFYTHCGFSSGEKTAFTLRLHEK